MAKASRGRRGTKSRKMKRKSGMSRRKRCWKGGAQTVFPANVNDESMLSASSLNKAQGLDYESLHAGQHGGAAVSLASAAPPGYTGMLDDSLRGAARISVLDESMQGIQGMSDQSGGRRMRKRGSMRKGKTCLMGGKRKRKGMSMRKGKTCLMGGKRKSMSMRKRKSMYMRKKNSMMGGKQAKAWKKAMAAVRKMYSRKMRGGAGYSLAGAQDFAAPGMLLSPSQEATALSGMNPEWKLASDPGAFQPAGL